MQQQPTISQLGLWPAMKSEQHTATSNDQLSGWTEKKLQSTYQSQTCTKKRSWSLFGGLLPAWSTTVFWISVKPLHLRSMLSKSVKSPKTAAGISQQKGPSSSPWQHLTKGRTTKSWRNWATKFYLIRHIHLTSWQLTCSVAKSCPNSVIPWTAAHQASLSFISPGVYSNSCALTQWCHPTISSSVTLFSCPQSFPESFPVSQ